MKRRWLTRTRWVAIMSLLFATLLAIPPSRASGGVDPDFAPIVNGDIDAIAIYPETDPVVANRGKILIGGDFTSVNGVERNAMARLNVDGSLDASFNPNLYLASPYRARVHSILIQTDGQVLIGGHFAKVGGSSGTDRTGLARMKIDDTLDSFNPSTNGIVYGLAVESDGDVILGGSFTQVASTTRNYVARVSSAGTLDSTFNPNASSVVRAIAVQGTNIYIGGDFVRLGDTTVERFAKVNATTGVPDPAFIPGTDGTVRTIVLDATGKILVGGSFGCVRWTVYCPSTSSANSRANIARIATDGTLESFNPNANGQVYSIAVESSGMIVLGGAFTTVGGQSRSRVARVNADGSLDTFSRTANGLVWPTTIQADGKILIGGAFSQVAGLTRDRVARLLSATVPGAPTSVAATAGDANASISWSAPASDGGSSITSYTVTSVPGSRTCTTSGLLSCVVSGLNNGTSYSFTVVAGNSIGSGTSSANSNAVTPSAPPAPDPGPQPQPAPSSPEAPLPSVVPVPALTSSTPNPEVRPFNVQSIRDLTPSQVLKLTASEISLLTPTALAGIIPGQVRVLTPEQIRAIQPRALRAMSVRAFESMTPRQLRALTSKQIRQLRRVQIDALGPRQRAALERER